MNVTNMVDNSWNNPYVDYNDPDSLQIRVERCVNLMRHLYGGGMYYGCNWLGTQTGLYETGSYGKFLIESAEYDLLTLRRTEAFLIRECPAGQSMAVTETILNVKRLLEEIIWEIKGDLVKLYRRHNWENQKYHFKDMIRNIVYDRLRGSPITEGKVSYWATIWMDNMYVTKRKFASKVGRSFLRSMQRKAPLGSYQEYLVNFRDNLTSRQVRERFAQDQESKERRSMEMEDALSHADLLEQRESKRRRLY